MHSTLVRQTSQSPQPASGTLRLLCRCSASLYSPAACTNYYRSQQAIAFLPLPLPPPLPPLLTQHS
jgi:hypothetical protein